MADGRGASRARAGWRGWLRRSQHIEELTNELWELRVRVSQLERQRSDLNRVLASLGEGVLAVDSSGLVLYANPVALEALELDEDTLIGSHLYVAVPHAVVADAIDDVMRGAQAGTRQQAECELVLDVGGAERALAIVVVPLRGGTHRDVEGAIAVIRDVTELRRLERARHDFFTNVSHELKTPITAIRGALETIVDDPDMSSEVRDRFLTSAYDHALRLSSLVTDLLALARLEHDRSALRNEPVDLVALVRDVVAARADAAARAEVEVMTGPDPSALVLELDHESIEQAISNLVDNAIAYSDPGEQVEVRVAVVGDEVRVHVRDSGVGIPDDALERVFERFYRVDAARSRARGGTGIGLSIVKHVAHAHDGAVDVTSTLGVGSEFVLRLPVSRCVDVGT